MEEENLEVFSTLEGEGSSAEILTIIVISCILIIILMLTGVFWYSTSRDNIISGVYIDNINVSGLSKEEAKFTIQSYLQENMPENLNLIHKDNYETSLNINQIQVKYDVDKAVEEAYQIGRSDNTFINIKDVFKLILVHSNTELELNYNKEDLNNFLEDVSSKLPDAIIQNSYYIDGNNLIITKGKSGYIVDTEKSSQKIIEAIKGKEYKDKKIELVTILEQPEMIDIDKIHSEIYKEPVNAYYQTDPYVVHPHENGVDFKISIDEAKNMLKEEKDEYTIPIKYMIPEVTTNMIGTEAFPDLLSSFTTKYNTREKDRTTNLIIAAGKINGTVVMPGETFSYNTVVGKRTIEAGYKNAAMYVDGKVVDGLAGGICQISTTLYNAVLYANLDIVERRNHQFVPSYSNAGRDATVVYGNIDFKFKNNREYPIKIECSVNKGIVSFKIYGLKQENEYEVVLSSRIVSSTATSLKSETYKTLKLNGEVVTRKTISKDTYKKH